MKQKALTVFATAAIVSGAYGTTVHASTYNVQKGDSLYWIANKYHTNIQQLKNLNHLQTDFLQINQILQVPTTVSAKSVTASTAASPTYTVVKGDCLSKIALLHKVTVANLKEWNHLNSDQIFIGQKLKVGTVSSLPSSSTVKPATVPSVQTPKSTPASSTQSSTITYTIKSGDTLGGIALQYKVSVANLKQWNHLTSDRIYVGKKLQITVVKTPSSTTVKPVTVPPVSPSKSAPVSSASSTGSYVIQSGDTLGKIALQFDMKVADLKRLNNLSSDFIFVGQILKVNGNTTSTVDSAVSANVVINIAKSLMGTPYVWGGSDASGVDCSGFVYYVFKQSGMDISRYSAAGYYDRSYYVDHPQPGDLVFFKDTYKPGISHVGIYLGNNQFIQADETHGVMISNLNSTYYQQHFDSFKRFY